MTKLSSNREGDQVEANVIAKACLSCQADSQQPLKLSHKEGEKTDGPPRQILADQLTNLLHSIASLSDHDHSAAPVSFKGACTVGSNS